MGQTTPNIGIFIPVAGETNYESSFASGMVNVDQHDHTGAPTKGVQIATTGLADGSVTYPKLNANVADTATGIGTDPVNLNKLQILGLLKELYQLGALTDGQLYVGKTGFPAIKTALTAGTGVTITFNAGAGTLTIAATANTSVVVQAFPASGVYTPTSGMRYCIIECVGGGGGGGGATAIGPVVTSAGGGGGGGGYVRAIRDAAAIGVSKVVTIGAAGTGAATGNNPGGNGGTTSVNTGTVIQATGGIGGGGSGGGGYGQGGAGGAGTGGDVNSTGTLGRPGISGAGNVNWGGGGGATYFGGNGAGSITFGAGGDGSAATGYGGGGGGGSASNTFTAAGGVGFAGFCVITEYM